MLVHIFFGGTIVIFTVSYNCHQKNHSNSSKYFPRNQTKNPEIFVKNITSFNLYSKHKHATFLVGHPFLIYALSNQKFKLL